MQLYISGFDLEFCRRSVEVYWQQFIQRENKATVRTLDLSLKQFIRQSGLMPCDQKNTTTSLGQIMREVLKPKKITNDLDQPFAGTATGFRPFCFECKIEAAGTRLSTHKVDELAGYSLMRLVGADWTIPYCLKIFGSKPNN